MPEITKDSQGNIVKKGIYGCKTCGYPEKKDESVPDKEHNPDESVVETLDVPKGKKKSTKKSAKKEVKNVS